MQFSVNSNTANHELTFMGDTEIKVMKAVYLEYIGEVLAKGNSGSLLDADWAVTGWNGTQHSIFTDSYVTVADRVNGFAENTDNALEDMARTPTQPAFQHQLLLERRRLGPMASTVAGDIVAVAVKYFEDEKEKEEVAQDPDLPPSGLKPIQESDIVIPSDSDIARLFPPSN